VTRDSLATYIDKAERALSSARVLVEVGDPEGACNRAYYSMFDAAHAALFALGHEEAATPIKTHHGLVLKFGLHVVKTSKLPSTYGEALNAVQRIRQIADYSGTSISRDEAVWAIEEATRFLEAVKSII
jgi:uncharacterized protein (UPF0332 family)